MDSDVKHTIGRRRRRDAGDEQTGNNAAVAAADETRQVEERLAQMELVRKKDRIQRVCADPSEWTTKELRDTAKKLNLPNTSSMSKNGLCALLSKHHEMELEKEVEDETPDYPPGCFDIISQGPMYDPIIASDGYSYNRSSLRKMLITSKREGKPCHSLYHPSVKLKNPFDDIDNFPKTWPLIANKSLKQWVEHWMLEHGLEVSENERKTHEHIPTPSRRNDLIPDAQGGIMQNGIYFIPPPEDDADMNASPNDDEDEDEVIELVPEWFEEDIQRIVDAARNEAPTMSYTKCNRHDMRCEYVNDEESAEKCLRRLLNACGCVVVNTIADKDVLLRLGIPLRVVVLDKQHHKIYIFNAANEDKWITTHSRMQMSYLVREILKCVWGRHRVRMERNSRVAVNVFENITEALDADQEYLLESSAEWICEKDIGWWEGEQHEICKFIPDWIEEDVQYVLSQCGNMPVSYVPGGSTLKNRQEICREYETTEECLRRLLVAYGCVVVNTFADKDILIAKRIPLPVVVLSTHQHAVRVYDEHGNAADTIREGLHERVNIYKLLEAILAMVWSDRMISTERNGNVMVRVSTKIHALSTSKMAEIESRRVRDINQTTISQVDIR